MMLMRQLNTMHIRAGKDVRFILAWHRVHYVISFEIPRCHLMILGEHFSKFLTKLVELTSILMKTELFFNDAFSASPWIFYDFETIYAWATIPRIVHCIDIR